MAYCPNCGNEIAESQRFCSECGTELDQENTTSTAAGSETADPNGETMENLTESVSSGYMADQSDGLLDVSLSELTRDQKIVIGGGTLTVISAFLPWASAFGFSVSGINGDGIITLVLGIVAAAVVFFEPLDSRNMLVAGVAGILIVLVALVSITSVAAIGVYLTLVGGAIVAFPWASQLISSYT